MGDSLAYSKTGTDIKKINEPNTDREKEMWDMVIEKHGRKEFEATYAIINRFGSDRFAEAAQMQIQAEVNIKLNLLGLEDTQKQQELIGLVSSFMILEEFK